MRLPSGTHLRVERKKIAEYLLCPTHPEGGSKASFFHSFEFRPERWQELADALRKHGASCPVVRVVESAFGTRYTVEGPLHTPSGRKPVVRTVWILEEGFAAPRLITAFPA